MIRKFLLSVLVAIAPMWAMAQDSENEGGMVIRLDEVKFSDPVLAPKAVPGSKPAELVANICAYARQNIEAAINFSQRFTVTDMEKAKKLDEELHEEMAMDLSKEERAKLMQKNAGKVLASDWVMDVDITQCKFTAHALRGAGTAYDAFLTLAITLKDRRDPNLRVISTQTFTTNPADIKVHKLKMIDAASEALGTMQGIDQSDPKKTVLKPGGLAFYFANQFDIYANGLGMENGLYKISAGANHGVDENTTFKMIYVTFDESAHKVVETPIAECKVQQLGPNSSLCKITKGEKELINAVSSGVGGIRVISILKKVIKEIKTAN